MKVKEVKEVFLIKAAIVGKWKFPGIRLDTEPQESGKEGKLI
jgi:hypothetical protein